MDSSYAISALTAGRVGGMQRIFRAASIAAMGLFYVFIHLYAAVYGSPDTQLMNSLHVTIALVLVFLLNPLARSGGYVALLWGVVDLLCILGSVLCIFYFLTELKTWTLRTIVFRPVDMAVGLLFCALIFEAVRRTAGMTLIVICLFLMAYALYANHFPGIFYGPPVTFKRLLQTILLGDAGIFGIAVSVMAQYVVIFILFGSVLNRIGGGRFFTRVAFSLFGSRRGGPAKAAVISSALMGTLSGSAIGNVVSTGVFTIPLMKRMGFKPAFAGGVEAAASNGGMIMPPVMGAVAFIMADIMGRPYVEIVIAAILPAILYYITMFLTVDLEARKSGLVPVEKGLMPRARSLMKRQGYYLIPLGVITVALLMNYSIVLVGVLAIAATVVLGLLQRRDRLDPVAIYETCEDAARSTAALSITAAAAGIMLGAIYATGVSYQISQEAAAATAGNLWMLVLLCGVLAIFMGMGMSAPAVYITLAATVIPILKLAGVPEMAAHFYAFYFGIASNITPPIALTAYAAAPIAQSKPFETGVMAGRLGFSCLLLPVLFIYHPAILMIGTPWEIALSTASSGLALAGCAIAMTGWCFTYMNGPTRLLMAVASACLFAPEPISSCIGLAAGAVILWVNWRQSKAGMAAPLSHNDSDAEEVLPAKEGWFTRMMGRRMSKELATDGVIGAAPAQVVLQDQDELLRSINEEPALEPRLLRASGLVVGWAVVLAVAALFHVAGSRFLHASAPFLWVGVLFAASLLSVAGLTFAGGVSRRRLAAPICAAEA